MEDEIRITSTKDQITEFKESFLWADIKRELNMWKVGFEGEYSAIVDEADAKNPSTASVLLHMGDINGRTKAVDYMLSIPDIFLQILEGYKDDSKHK